MIISLQIIYIYKSISVYVYMSWFDICGVRVCRFKLVFASVDGESSLLFSCMGWKFVCFFDFFFDILSS